MDMVVEKRRDQTTFIEGDNGKVKVNECNIMIGQRGVKDIEKRNKINGKLVRGKTEGENDKSKVKLKGDDKK